MKDDELLQGMPHVESENTVSFLIQYILSYASQWFLCSSEDSFLHRFSGGLCDLAEYCLNENFLWFCLQHNCKEDKNLCKIML